MHKLILATTALLALLVFTACAAPAAAPAPAAEAEVAPTEAAAEEAAPTDAPAEEAADENAADAGEVVTYVVDTEASTVQWYGSKPVGGSEEGTVQIADGQLNFSGSELVDGTAIIDMTTIAPTSQQGNMLNMLTEHLLSDDFFGVERYPTATRVPGSSGS